MIFSEEITRFSMFLYQLKCTFAIFYLIEIILIEGQSPFPSNKYIRTRFQNYGFIKDGIIPVAPEQYTLVKFHDNSTVELGNLMVYDQIWQIPGFIWWKAEPNSTNTLVYLDVDTPNDEFPVKREFLQWLVGNIPEYRVEKGYDISPYIIPLPPPVMYGVHRLVFLVYKQPHGVIKFDETPLVPLSIPHGTLNFSLKNFVKKYNLIGPIAGNFYRIDWSDEVNHIRYDAEPDLARNRVVEKNSKTAN